LPTARVRGRGLGSLIGGKRSAVAGRKGDAADDKQDGEAGENNDVEDHA
jgi:hypothetical protein